MKSEMIQSIEELGIVWKYLINGLMGGVALSIYKKSKFWDSFRQVIIGGLISGYCTPVISTKFGMGPELVGFTSFAVGITGMAIIDGLYKYVGSLIKKWKEAIIIINKKS